MRDVEAAGARSFNHREAGERVAGAGAVDVHDVERSAGDGGGSDDFAERFDGRAGLKTAGAAHVGVDGHAALGCEAEHVDDLGRVAPGVYWMPMPMARPPASS